MHLTPPQDPDQLPQLRGVDGAAPIHVKLCESVAVGGDLLVRMSVLRRRMSVCAQ